MDEIECTRDVILGLAHHDVPEHTCVVAARELHARGPWQAAPGGLWLTALWRPSLDAREAALLALAGAWGVREAVERHTGLACGIAWPGDLVLGDRRVGSVAVDGRVGLRRVDMAAVAVGLDVNNPVTCPSRTSLARELGREIVLGALVDEVALALREARLLLAQPAELHARVSRHWRDRDVAVTVDAGHTLLAGTARRLDLDGALVLEVEGREVRVDDPALARFTRVVDQAD